MAWGPMKSQPPLKASDIKFQQFKYGIDQSYSVLYDDQTSIVTTAPYFRASATVEIPKLPPGADIQIGWIQVCTEMTLVCVYGDEGIISWEIPELVSGKYDMMSDSCGTQFPWYGATNEVTGVKGPSRSKIVRTVFMDDNLKTDSTWNVPKKKFTPQPTLNFVYRKQKFYAYLVLKDVKNNVYEILKTLEWSIEMAIDVDINLPVGKRSTLLGPLQQQCPKVLPENLTPPIQCYALRAPTCNTAQMVVWRPYYGDIEVLYPPTCTTMNVDTYALYSDVHSKMLMLYTKENFLSGQI